MRVSSSEGSDAVQATYRAGYLPDSGAAWYRRWFLAHAWGITGDTRLPDGTVVLHADSAVKPLWLMIPPHPNGASFHPMAAEPK